MSANNQILVLAPFHKFFVPCRVFFKLPMEGGEGGLKRTVPVLVLWWPLSNWGYGLAPFRLGIWTGHFPIGIMPDALFNPKYAGHVYKIMWSILGI